MKQNREDMVRDAARKPACEQAADHPDIGLEDLHLAVDVEMQVLLDPTDAFFQLGIQMHEIERVERFNDAVGALPQHQALARYTNDAGNHVTVEIRPATSLVS